MLLGKECIGGYGLGRDRTMAEFEEYIGVSFENRRVLRAQPTADEISLTDLGTSTPKPSVGSKEATMSAALALVEAFLKSNS